jgi:hypothetical protein
MHLPNPCPAVVAAAFLALVSSHATAENPVLKENWSERLEYLGVVIEDDNYHIWGSSPIRGDDGKVHVFCARFPVKTGFGQWHTLSEIAHYVGDQPEGPFKEKEVLLRAGATPPGSWDCGTQHNPSISKIDDLYVLVYHSNEAVPGDRKRDTHAIGMLTAPSVNGPWKKVGCILKGADPDDPGIWSHKHECGVDNPSLIKHPNGKYHLYYRGKWKGLEGDNTYGVAIADKLEGPYVHYPKRVINNTRYVEDPHIFVYQDIIYMLVTDNYKHKGLLLTSRDGLHFEFNDAVLGFKELAAYVGEETVKRSPNYRGPAFERPQLLLNQEGIPTHLYAPSGVNVSGGKGSCCYLLKIHPAPGSSKE